ncbi:MAG: HlyD family secretion protein, partial [Blastocatellia bacterium]|nr:HlyD family secretion protein [Blastocatellia bacterium]
MAAEAAAAKKKGTRTYVFMALVVLLTAVVAYFYAQSQTYQSTDDAFIDGHVTNVAPQIAGRVEQVLVNDNQEVKKGQLLVRIDPRDYNAALLQKKAGRESTNAEASATLASVQQQIAHVATLEATVASDQATADADRANADKAAKDYVRYQKLAAQKVISSQDLDAYKAASIADEATYNAAVKKVASDKAQVMEAQAQVNAYEALYQSILAQVHQQDANVQTAELNQSYTNVYAPLDGRITNKSVQVGNYVQIGQNMMAIVPDHIYITANFKESQIGLMRPGQPVEIEVDALRKKFDAHVDSIQAGSGAAFSLLPPENATGNYVKVVQRVPVKIEFDRLLTDSAGVSAAG